MSADNAGACVLLSVAIRCGSLQSVTVGFGLIYLPEGNHPKNVEEAAYVDQIQHLWHWRRWRAAVNLLTNHGPSKDSLRRRKLRACLSDRYRTELIFGKMTT
jgi:hypothetical protein